MTPTPTPQPGILDFFRSRPSRAARDYRGAGARR